MDNGWVGWMVTGAGGLAVGLQLAALWRTTRRRLPGWAAAVLKGALRYRR